MNSLARWNVSWELIKIILMIPDDTEIHGVRLTNNGKSVEFVISNPNFPENPIGEIMTEVSPNIIRHERPATDSDVISWNEFGDWGIS